LKEAETMNQRVFSLVLALLFAAPLAGTAQQPQLQKQLKPNELATNVAGVTTIAAPPAGFDALSASDQDLEYHGFPPKPDEVRAPKAFASWQKAMKASKNRVTPVLEVTKNFAGPAKLTAGTAATPATGTAANSYNWSGYVNTNGVTKYGSTSFYYIIGDYVVPIARQAYSKCDGTWDYSVTWVGIDGWGSGDVLQAGSEADAYCSGSSTSTYYSAWYEWYPNGWTRIPSLPIVPGDDLFVEVWSTSSTAGHAYLVNYNTNQCVTINFSAPSGTQLVGNSAEWVVERPGVNGGLATLANYISDYFSDAYAYNFGYSAVDPGSAGSFPVTMLDNSGNPISYPTALGVNAVWMQDEGTARY
jgi:hypothetical protein